jgi:thiol-disulfide isomerase/thioredoxin
MKNILLAIYVALASSVQAEIQHYDVGSLNDIQTQYEGHEFLLILWSHDCPPCRKELEYLETIQQQQVLKNIVLINTDGKDELTTVEKILTSHNLMTLDNWIFSNANLERLRYSIDENWAGELPKSYFYQTSHQRRAKSGSLSIELLKRWLENIQP